MFNFNGRGMYSRRSGLSSLLGLGAFYAWRNRDKIRGFIQQRKSGSSGVSVSGDDTFSSRDVEPDKHLYK